MSLWSGMKRSGLAVTPQYESFANGEGSAVHLACRASDLIPVH